MARERERWMVDLKKGKERKGKENQWTKSDMALSATARTRQLILHPSHVTHTSRNYCDQD
jgi:hypothetical protein